jgi:PHD/YefM family antitoxin component YafN of YafNO toxin-antitoxin module
MAMATASLANSNGAPGHLGDESARLTHLKRNHDSILGQADDEPVAVLNYDRPEACLVPAPCFERLMQHLDSLRRLLQTSPLAAWLSSLLIDPAR